MKCYQACYGKPGNNWQLLNVSKDTPPYMVSFFENLGNSCTPQNIGTDVLLDANNNPVVLYELISSENIVCVLRAKYGDRDNFGRPKMFAHGFMTEAENLLNDPAEILSIDDSNFHYSDDETADIAPELLFSDKLSLSSAISISGIDKDKWNLMMKCVYAMLSSPTDYPLYIKCNGDLNTIKATIYCVLYALPISLRYLLSFSNANSLSYAKFKRIMFVDKINSGDMFFDLDTGATNLSSELTEVEQYQDRFLSYYAFASMPEDQFPMYCNTIQSTLDQLSFGYVSSIDEINLAHTIVEGIEPIAKLNDEELTKFLLKTLVASPLQNKFVDDYIADILYLFDEHSIVPNDTIMKRLELRNDKTPSENYVEAYKKIRMRVLLSKGSSEVISFLNEQYGKSKSIFDEWYQLIIGIPDGKEAIYKFFEIKIKSCSTAEIAKKLFKEVRIYCGGTDLDSICFKKWVQITKESIFRTSIIYGDFEYELNNFRSQVKEFAGDDDHGWTDRTIIDIKKEYWNHFDYSEFEFNSKCISNCKAMYNSDNYDSSIALLIDLYEAVQSYERFGANANYYTVEKALIAFINRNQLRSSQYSEIAPKIKKYVFDALCQRDGHRHFCTWLTIIQLEKSTGNPIPQFIKFDLPVVCDPNCFERAFRESPRMKEIALDLKNWLNVAIDNAERYQLSSDDVKILKKDLKAIDDYGKELVAEERQRMREQRKQERNNDFPFWGSSSPDKSESLPKKSHSHGKESTHSKGFIFDNIFGGKKK